MSSKIKSLHRRSIFLVSYKFFHFFSVIATRGCIEWLRKKRLSTQSLEDTSHTQLGKTTYSEYVIQENERTTAETQREVAQKLLAKLREKERIVITLHYFGEMTHEEISEFLGTSVGTINRDGSNLRQLVSEKGPDALRPTWSPQGDETIYQIWRGLRPHLYFFHVHSMFN